MTRVMLPVERHEYPLGQWARQMIMCVNNLIRYFMPSHPLSQTFYVPLTPSTCNLFTRHFMVRRENLNLGPCGVRNWSTACVLWRWHVQFLFFVRRHLTPRSLAQGRGCLLATKQFNKTGALGVCQWTFVCVRNRERFCGFVVIMTQSILKSHFILDKQANNCSPYDKLCRHVIMSSVDTTK